VYKTFSSPPYLKVAHITFRTIVLTDSPSLKNFREFRAKNQDTPAYHEYENNSMKISQG
jgi:hypothetical protein